MKFFVVNNRLKLENPKRYLYIEADNHELGMIEATRRVGHDDVKIQPAVNECQVTPEYTNIYLCTLDNGEGCCDYQDYTITVTAKDEVEARTNAMAKFNGNIWGTGFGDANIKNGGTLSVNLEYENVILSKKI